MSEKAESGAVRGVLALLIGIVVVILGVNFAFSQEVETSSLSQSSEEFEFGYYRAACPQVEDFNHDNGQYCSMINATAFEGVEMELVDTVNFYDPYTKQEVTAELKKACVDGVFVHVIDYDFDRENLEENAEGLPEIHYGIRGAVAYDSCLQEDPRDIMIDDSIQVAEDLEQGGVTVVHKTSMTQVANVQE